jgi:hypothetical protein
MLAFPTIWSIHLVLIEICSSSCAYIVYEVDILVLLPLLGFFLPWPIELTWTLYHGGGVLAHRTRCTYYGKRILNPFQNVKKIRQKILSVHLNTLCSPTKFCDEKIFFVACIKKTKKCSRK